MLPRITDVRYLGGFRLHLTFSDNVSGEVDLSGDIAGQGGVFQPLEEPDFFAKVRVDADAGTIAWPNGVDFDPDVMYARITRHASVPEQVRRAI